MNHRCVFITKEPWFQELFSINLDLQMEVSYWNMLEYQKVLKKMRYLHQERIKNLKEKIRSQHRAVWIRRTVNASAAASNDTATLTAKGDTQA